MPRPQSTRVKQLGEGRIGGYGVVFGNPDQRDLYGDYFTADTDFWLGEYRDQPVMYDHALGQLPMEMDAKIPRNFKLGRVVKAVVDTIGLWIEAVIEEHNEWAEAVLSLVDQGIMHWSSGSVSHLVTYGPDYQITSWPVVEMSVTPTPAEPRSTDIVRLKHFVSNQDTPEATALKAARRQEPATVQPDHTDRSSPMKGHPTMTLIINDKAARAVVWAIAEDNQDQLKAAFDAYVKQDGNAIAELVRPMAEELAGVAGVDVDTAQQYLIEFVAQNAAGGGEEPEPEPAPEAEPAPMMSADVQKAINKAVEARFLALLKQQPDGAFLTPKQKNVQIQKPKTESFSWVRAVRAVSQHDKPVLKAMGINPDTAGGFLVPPEHSTEVIGLLRSGAPVLSLCRTVPMQRDTLYIPKLTGGATAYWTAENASISDSTPATGQVTLVAKKLTALVKISNEWLDDSDPEMETMIREDIAQTLAEAVDNAILEGSGVGNEPTGLSVIPDITKTALDAAPTVANIIDMISRVEVANVRQDPMWNFVFHPRDKAVLAQVADTTSGDFLWTELGLPGHTLVGGYPTTLRGYPYVNTTQITIDTDNNNETKIYFGQFGDVVVGMRKTIELAASGEAGDAFQYDQTWIRAIMRLDVNIRHAESIEVLTDVRTS